MAAQHQTLSEGRWFDLSLAEQMGNIGGEVHRTLLAERSGKKDFQSAFHRTLELIDLTLRDPRLRNRLREITRLRELFSAAALGTPAYKTTLDDIDRYLMQFAVAARLRK